MAIQLAGSPPVKKRRNKKTDETLTMVNRNGKEVPISNINPYTKRRDRLVKRLMSRAEKLQDTMRREKAAMMSDIEKFMKYSAESKKYSKELNIKGNLALSDYSSLMKVELKRADIIEFDERLNVAKGIIDNLLSKWTDDDSLNANLKLIISEAFNMDKKGNINRAMIIKLTKLDIKDPEWEKAVQLIHESMDAKGSRDYIQFKKRDGIQGDFESIELNFGALKIN
jgi:hypothetical protein